MTRNVGPRTSVAIPKRTNLPWANADSTSTIARAAEISAGNDAYTGSQRDGCSFALNARSPSKLNRLRPA